MAKLKGLDKLNQAIKFVKEVAEQAQKELDAKREKNDGNSDKWQESEKAEEWRNHSNRIIYMYRFFQKNHLDIFFLDIFSFLKVFFTLRRKLSTIRTKDK